MLPPSRTIAKMRTVDVDLFSTTRFSFNLKEKSNNRINCKSRENPEPIEATRNQPVKIGFGIRRDTAENANKKKNLNTQ